MKKNVKGITLVSMVITIIVMLILAGVSISMVTGDNGVLTRATEGSVKTKLASVKEDVELSITSNQSNYYGDFAESTALAGNKNAYLTAARLNQFTTGVKLLANGAATLSLSTSESAGAAITVNCTNFTNENSLVAAVNARNTATNTNLTNGSSRTTADTTSGYREYVLYVSDGSGAGTMGENLYVLAVHFEQGFFVIDNVGIIQNISTTTLNQGALLTTGVLNTLNNTLNVRWLDENRDDAV